MTLAIRELVWDRCIASMTKAVTAAAVMMLVEEGKLRLDGPAEQWLPELANRQVLHRLDGRS